MKSKVKKVIKTFCLFGSVAAKALIKGRVVAGDNHIIEAARNAPMKAELNIFISQKQ